MTEQEIINEYNTALQADFPVDQIEDITLQWLSCAAMNRTSKEMNMTFESYVKLIRGEGPLSYAIIGIAINNAMAIPYAIYLKQGTMTIDEYVNFVKETGKLSALWEDYVGPYRKAMNQKLEIMKTKIHRN